MATTLLDLKIGDPNESNDSISFGYISYLADILINFISYFLDIH